MSVSSTINTIVTDAATVAQEFHTAAPWVEKLLPLVPAIGAPAASVVQVLDSLQPVFLNALAVLAQANGGNLVAASVELANHVTQGQANSPVLSGANTSSAS